MEDDHELEEITERYGSQSEYFPKMMCGDVKKRCVEVIQDVVANHRNRLGNVPEDVSTFARILQPDK